MCKIVLSIVIPTRNRADLLQKVLESIEKQKADQQFYEVIVIDNGSSDKTKDVARGFKGRIRNFRYFYDAKPGLHVGRNKGLKESRGELVGYLDDDVILFPNWINTVIEAFEDIEVMYVEGSVVPYDMSLLTQDFREKYEIRKNSYRFIYPVSCFWEDGIAENDMRIHKAPTGSFFGANSVYRKSVLLECKGFHPDGMPNNLLMYRGDGESYVAEFMRSQGMKAMYYAQASVYHMIDKKRVTATYIDYMFFRNGISAMYTVLRENGMRGAVVRLRSLLVGAVHTKIVMQEIRGELYLLLYYFFYPRICDWVHKEDYFT